MGAGWGQGTGRVVGSGSSLQPACSRRAVGRAGVQLRGCLGPGLRPRVSGRGRPLRCRARGKAGRRQSPPFSGLSLMGPDIVDIKPANMEDLTEVITASEFHPHHCNLFVYSSSKGSLRLCDMRAAALCDKHSKRKCPFPPGTRWAVGAAVLCPGRVGTVQDGGPWAPCCCHATGRGSLILPPPTALQVPAQAGAAQLPGTGQLKPGPGSELGARS